MPSATPRAELQVERKACLIRVTNGPPIPGFKRATEEVSLEDLPEPAALVLPQDRRRVDVERTLFGKGPEVRLALGVLFGKDGLHRHSVGFANQSPRSTQFVHPHRDRALLVQDAALLRERHSEVRVIPTLEDHRLSQWPPAVGKRESARSSGGRLKHQRDSTHAARPSCEGEEVERRRG